MSAGWLKVSQRAALSGSVCVQVLELMPVFSILYFCSDVSSILVLCIDLCLSWVWITDLLCSGEMGNRLVYRGISVTYCLQLTGVFGVSFLYFWFVS